MAYMAVHISMLCRNFSALSKTKGDGNLLVGLLWRLDL